MKLTKEFVNNCRRIGVLRYFLCQAIDQVDEKDKEIAELEEKRRWRKCSEEKPNEEQFVLAWLTEDGKRGFFLTSCFINGEFLIGEDPHGCKPTYWMPLPSDPKEQA